MFTILGASEPNLEGSVVFPQTMMAGGLPTTIKLPAGAVVTPVTATPVPFTRDGVVFGSKMEVRGYRYAYDVTIPNNHREFTGPFNQRHDEAYAGNVPPNYPHGTTVNYRASEWVVPGWVSMATSFASQELANFTPPSRIDDGMYLGQQQNMVKPFDSPRPVAGLAAIMIDGVEYSTTARPLVKLVPKLAVALAPESRNVLVPKSAQVQTNPVIVEIINHMTTSASNISVTAAPKEEGTGITVTSSTVSIPAKGRTMVTLTATIPANYEGNPTILVTASHGGEQFREGYQVMDYTQEAFALGESNYMHHLERQYMYMESSQSMAVAPVSLPDDDIKIGFVATGSNDVIWPFIQAMYTDPAKATANSRIIDRAYFDNLPEDVAEAGKALKASFDTVIVGQQPTHVANNALLMQSNGAGGAPNARKLLAFAEVGGNLVFSHTQRNPFGGSGQTAAADYLPLGKTSVALSGNLNLSGCPIYIDPDMQGHTVFTYPNNLDVGGSLEGTVRSSILHANDQAIGFQVSSAPVWFNWQGQRTEWAPRNAEDILYNAVDWTESDWVGMFWGRDRETAASRLKPAVFGTAVGPDGGNVTHVSIIIGRHFPELAVGAIQIMANLLSMGYNEMTPGEFGWGNTPATTQYVTASMNSLMEHMSFDGFDSLDESGSEEVNSEEVAQDKDPDESAPVVWSRAVTSRVAASPTNAKAATSFSMSGIGDYLDALDAVYINDIKVDFVINKAAGTITIDKDTPVLNVSSGSKALVVKFLASGYEDVIVSSITVTRPSTRSVSRRLPMPPSASAQTEQKDGEDEGGSETTPSTPDEPEPEPELPAYAPMLPIDPAGTVASSTKSSNTLLIGDKQMEFPAINIHGYNWLKLRDIAMILMGTNKGFSLSYNAETNTIVLTTGGTYTPVGTELEALPGDITAVASPQRLMIDGVLVEVAAYNIDGYNYFRLRDLAILLDFAVNFDAASGLITLDLENPYKE